VTGNKNRPSGSRKLQSLQAASTDSETDNMYGRHGGIAGRKRTFVDYFWTIVPSDIVDTSNDEGPSIVPSIRGTLPSCAWWIAIMKIPLKIIGNISHRIPGTLDIRIKITSVI